MKITRAAFLIAALLACFAGCGGSDGASNASSNAPQFDNAALTRAKGKAIFARTCVACHGENGEGVEGLGKDWTQSEYIANSSDQELVDFLKVGRTIDDPLSDGISPMPPKGGDPTLNDEDLRNVVAYMRTLNE